MESILNVGGRGLYDCFSIPKHLFAYLNNADFENEVLNSIAPKLPD